MPSSRATDVPATAPARHGQPVVPAVARAAAGAVHLVRAGAGPSLWRGLVEAHVIRRVVRERQAGAAGEVVAAAAPLVVDAVSRRVPHARVAVLDAGARADVAAVGVVLARLTPEEAHEVRAWILDVATGVAAAFPDGRSEQRIRPARRAALGELVDLLYA